MDTIKLITESSNSYELLKIILDFIGIIIWPILVFIILCFFRKEIKTFLSKTKRLEIPGGFSLQVEEDIQEAKEIAVEIETERKKEPKKIIPSIDRKNKFNTDANKRMIELGLTPSPSGLDINYYKQIAEADPRLALIGLRTDFEMMLKNLAKGSNVPISNTDPISKIVSKLYEANAITQKQYEFINKVFKISSLAAHGAPMTKAQAFEILDIGQVLIDDYISWLYWNFEDK